MLPMCSRETTTIHSPDFAVRDGFSLPGDQVRAGSTARYAYRVGASIAQYLPVVRITGRQNDVAQNLHAALHRSHPVVRANRRWRHDLGDWLAEARDPDGLLGLLHLIKQRQALRLELRNSNFLHDHFIRS